MVAEATCPFATSRFEGSHSGFWLVSDFSHMLIQYQNSIDDFRELTDAITVARRPVNGPIQIAVLMAVFGAYYAVTRYLWFKAGDTDGNLAWVNMWIAFVAFGFTWLALTLPASFRSRKFPWLTIRQAVSLGSFVAMIGALIFEQWIRRRFSAVGIAHHSLSWQVFLPHSIWLLLLGYVSTIAAINHKSHLTRQWTKHPELHRHKTADISAAGIVVSDLVSRLEYQWPGFVKWEETRHLILLFISETNALMIPKEAFGSAEELNAMRHLANLIPRETSRGFTVEMNAPKPVAA